MHESAADEQFAINEAQRDVAAFALEIAEREVAPHAAQWNRDHHFPTELLPVLAESGMLGLFVPEEYGGTGLDYVSYALTIEAFSRVDAGTGTTLSVHAMVCKVIALLGSDVQKAALLPGLASGGLAAFALTEPGAGSDAAHIVARATRVDGGWRLNGRKQWCTNGAHATVVMGMFRTSDDDGRGITAFLVPRHAPGVVLERKTEKKAGDTHERYE